jgi:hypothetical protein
MERQTNSIDLTNRHAIVTGGVARLVRFLAAEDSSDITKVTSSMPVGLSPHRYFRA